MPWEEELEVLKQDKAARVIQQAWKSFLNVAIFQHFKSLIDLRRQGEPRQIVKYINPKEVPYKSLPTPFFLKAELLDAAAGIHVRFRLGGVKFPPDIYYKIFTHRPIEDLCANSPRNYAKLPAKHTSHNKNDHLQEEDHSGWYHRIENNGWRPVSDTFWLSTDSIVVEDKKESEFHFSKLKRRQDLEKKRKLRKIEWMRQMYYSGSLEAKSTHRETLGLIHTATKGLIRAFEDGGIDSVMEWEVDEVLNWTNTLNFDERQAESNGVEEKKKSLSRMEKPKLSLRRNELTKEIR
ncbi:protein MFI isoform X8 [Macaca nemestrina]